MLSCSRVTGASFVSESSEMDHPVTRRELREDLANFPTKAELREELATFEAERREELGSLKTELREELATKKELREEFAAKVDLQNMTQLLLREMDSREKRSRSDMAAQFEHFEHRIVTTLRDDLAHHFRAAEESKRSQISMIDETYADLPGRVTALEARRKRR
jgi:hypothetical protein